MSDSFATPWTIAHQAPLSMGFPRQEFWTGLPFPSLRDLPDPGVEFMSPAASPALQADFLLLNYRETQLGCAIKIKHGSSGTWRRHLQFKVRITCRVSKHEWVFIHGTHCLKKRASFQGGRNSPTPSSTQLSEQKNDCSAPSPEESMTIYLHKYTLRKGPNIFEDYWTQCWLDTDTWSPEASL